MGYTLEKSRGEQDDSSNRGNGFIGSCLIKKLNRQGETDIYISDECNEKENLKNLEGAKFIECIPPDNLIEWLKVNVEKIGIIVHLGGCSATDQVDVDYLNRTNYEFTRELYTIANNNKIKFIYASSATTYGDGEEGFSDKLSPEELNKLRPSSKYGESKHQGDLYIVNDKNLQRENIIGLKLFNVYGPNEYHKEGMASSVMRMYNQFRREGIVEVLDPGNERRIQRDFVYIKDVLEVIEFFMKNNVESGLYNVGSGVSRSFGDIAKLVVRTARGQVDPEEVIVKKTMPEEMRRRYQYYTCANLEKLREAGYRKEFYSLEEGVEDYIVNYLKQGMYY